jgi:hypothetical protein
MRKLDKLLKRLVAGARNHLDLQLAKLLVSRWSQRASIRDQALNADGTID